MIKASAFQKFSRELAYRFLYLATAFLLTFLVSYCQAEDFFYLLVKPYSCNHERLMNFGSRDFIFTDFTEGLRMTFVLASMVGVYTWVPLLFYSSWAFLVPSLYNQERQRVTRQWLFFLSIQSLVLLMTYVWGFPFIFHFFEAFEVHKSFLHIHLEARMTSFLSVGFSLFGWSHFLSSLPFLFFMGVNAGYLSCRGATWNRSLLLGALLLFASLLAPPDIMVQVFVTCFFFAMAEILFFFALLAGSYKK